MHHYFNAKRRNNTDNYNCKLHPNFRDAKYGGKMFILGGLICSYYISTLVLRSKNDLV